MVIFIVCEVRYIILPNCYTAAAIYKHVSLSLLIFIYTHKAFEISDYC